MRWITGFPQRVGAQVILMWEPHPGAARYVVTRSGGESPEPVRTTISTNHLIDEKAKAADTLTYQVSALDAANAVLAQTPLAVVKGSAPLGAPKWGGVHQDGPRLLMNWQGDRRAVYYNVYRNEQGKPARSIASVSVTNYADEEVKVGVTYEYSVRAVDETGVESKDSGRISFRIEQFDVKRQEVPVEKRKYDVARFYLAPEVKLGEPTDLVLRSGFLYVTDTGSRSVMVLGLDGKLLRRFGTRPQEYQGVWGIPWGISADAYGRRFAVTYMQSTNFRVFDEQGAMILDVAVTPPPELKPEQYLPNPPQPMDVVIEDQEGFWVTDYTYGQVIYYDVRGKEVGRIGKSRAEKDYGPFRSLSFLTIHPGSGYIFVVDPIQKKVFRLFNDGNVAGFWGGEGQGEEGALYLPKGIEINEKGDVLVIDGMLSTLQFFTQAGKLTGLCIAADEDERPIPRGMVTMAANRENGDLYVISKIENSLFRLRPVR